MSKRVGWSLLGTLVAVTLLFAGCVGDEPKAQPTVISEQETTDASVVTTTVAATDPTTSEISGTLPAVEGKTIKTASGLEVIEVVAGTGETPKAGDLISVHYTGMLSDGTVFDSSYTRGQPIAFPLGQGAVIPGWDEAFALLKMGCKARLTIPAELAYGASGRGGVIPPNATLVFDVELVSISAGAPDAPTVVNASDYVTTVSGLKYYDFVVGNGAAPQAGQTVFVHYTGWLEDGKKFDSSLDRGEPFPFIIGQGQVIQGWDEGVLSMKVGGKRQLVIPAELGYGAQGAGGVIPPDATLIFEVELLEMQ